MTMYTPNTPAYVRAFVDRVAREQGIRVHSVVYRRSTSPGNSGRAFPSLGRMVLTLDPKSLIRERQATMLHELAHLSLPSGENHGRRFYERLFDLAETYRLRAVVLRSESRYMKMAVTVAKERRWPGTRKAAAAWSDVAAARAGWRASPVQRHGRLMTDEDWDRIAPPRPAYPDRD